MRQITVGDLVKRLVPNDGKTVNGHYIPRVYKVVRIDDYVCPDGYIEKNSRLALQTKTGKVLYTIYAWEVEVVKTAYQEQIETYRVQLARLAQLLDLNRDIPGSTSNRLQNLQKLYYFAQTQSEGWEKLFCKCIDKVLECKLSTNTE